MNVNNINKLSSEYAALKPQIKTKAKNASFTGTANVENENKNKSKLIKALVLATIAATTYIVLKKTNVGQKIIDKIKGIKDKVSELPNKGEKIVETTGTAGVKHPVKPSVPTKPTTPVKPTTPSVETIVKPPATDVPKNPKKYPYYIDKFETETAAARKKREIDEAWRLYEKNKLGI